VSLIIKGAIPIGVNSQIKRLTESAIRVAPRCPVYAACGGCQLQHVSYPAQLELKRRQVSDAIERIGGLKGVSVLPVKGAENPWNYRNKMQFPVGRAAGEIAIGCFARGSHTIVDTADCLIQQAGNNALIAAMRAAGDWVAPLAIKAKLPPRAAGTASARRAHSLPPALYPLPCHWQRGSPTSPASSRLGPSIVWFVRYLS